MGESAIFPVFDKDHPSDVRNHVCGNGVQSAGEEHCGHRPTARDGQRHRQAALGQVKGLPSLLEAQGDPGQIQGESPFASSLEGWLQRQSHVLWHLGSCLVLSAYLRNLYLRNGLPPEARIKRLPFCVTPAALYSKNVTL